MSRKKPDIGVTGPDRGGEAAWWFTRFAIWLQGGKAIRISPCRSKRVNACELDGLVLGGGADINPVRYGAELLISKPPDKPTAPGPGQWIYVVISAILFPILFILRNIFSIKRSKMKDAAEGRDDLEFTLLQEALEKGIPVLGICRGSQLINVQFGGSLYQDIGTFYTETPQIQTIWPRKRVTIKPNSKLEKIINAGAAWVNALHNQAVDKVGSPLVVAAQEANGIVQAIEHPGYPFLLGVQWHPEYMPQIPFQRNIFKELVKRAEAKRQKYKVKKSIETQMTYNGQVQSSGMH